ncbi:MAG TPA: gamma-glutamyltransferase [Chloroflexota bacterium]|nr:gamma-glutamyltransferase [Chloroflexota bacterium]
MLSSTIVQVLSETRASSAAGALGGPHGGAYRAPAVGVQGAVSAAHGLAATAGLRILMQGGNAVDAAVAVGAALSVVEPFMSGLGGGGGFMTIHEARAGTVHVLDYVGRTPAAADPSAFANLEALDADIRSTCVPGTLGGWLAALDRFGSLDRASVFQPAIDLAEHGWPITSFGARMLAEQADRLGRYPSSRATYWPKGRPPLEGERVELPNLAQTYRTLAAGGADAFYRGEVGERLVRAVQAAGGWLTSADLAAFTPVWREPLAVDFRGYRIFMPPPPSLGFQTLESLSILAGDDLEALGLNSAEYLHLVLEAIKLASADRTHHVRAGRPTINALLDPDYAAERRARIDPRRAAPSEGERYLANKTGEVAPGDPGRYARDHTTHFEAADRLGNLVTVTQSNGGAFGSGFVAGDTGIVLNNFLYWTDLDPASPTYMQPNAPRESSMSPCIVARGDGQPVLGIGTPGSFGILQTTLQVLLNRLVFGLNVQASIEAPRVRAFEQTIVDVEARVSEPVRAGLTERGHQVRPLEPFTWRVGGVHAIAYDPDTGILSAGADPRRDGQAVAF